MLMDSWPLQPRREMERPKLVLRASPIVITFSHQHRPAANPPHRTATPECNNPRSVSQKPSAGRDKWHVLSARAINGASQWPVLATTQ